MKTRAILTVTLITAVFLLFTVSYGTAQSKSGLGTGSVRNAETINPVKQVRPPKPMGEGVVSKTPEQKVPQGPVYKRDTGDVVVSEHDPKPLGFPEPPKLGEYDNLNGVQVLGVLTDLHSTEIGEAECNEITMFEVVVSLYRTVTANVGIENLTPQYCELIDSNVSIPVGETTALVRVQIKGGNVSTQSKEAAYIRASYNNVTKDAYTWFTGCQY